MNTVLAWGLAILGGLLVLVWTLSIWAHDVTDDQPGETLNPVWATLILGGGGLLLLRSGLNGLGGPVSDLLLLGVFLVGMVVALMVGANAARATLIRQQEALQAAHMKLNSAYRARSELIPNLVQVVRSFTKTEEDTITRVLDAQQKLDQGRADAAAPREMMAGVQVLMHRLMEFPQLQSAPMYRQLLANLTTTQSDITHYTGEYNTLAARFNTAVRTFPLSAYARRAGFAPVPYLDADLSPEERSSKTLLSGLN